jgi:acetylornithine deacetylase/succinyl-diaminopimelate desuccinylase-like protein
MNEVTCGYFEKMAAFQSDPQVAADMRAVAQTVPNAQAAARLAAASSYYNALMRTTCVATRLEGGHANNALPQMAAANVNCRILPGEAPAAVRQKVVEVIADASISVTFVDEAKPSSPSPLTRDVMRPIESITTALWPGVVVVPVMDTEATDGLYLRSRDERVGVQPFFDGLEFQCRLIKGLASPASGTR